MADVVAREHGGGCGGDPGGNQQPPRSGCGGPKKGRKEAKNLDLRRRWKKNGKRPLPIEFDDVNHDQTWRPIGDNGDMFISLVGTLVRVIPYRYSSWETVPASDKAPIIPSIETYFDMRPHYEGPYKDEIISGIQMLCSERYRGQKSRFKDKWFSSKGGVESAERLRQMPPPNMNHQEWSDHIDYYCRGDVVRRSQANTEVRAHQIHQSSHGRTEYAQYRYQNRHPDTLEPPSLIDLYQRYHTRAGQFTDDVVAENHRRMVEEQNAQVRSEHPLTEREIMTFVLGERRGHIRGVGRKVTTASSSASGSGAQSQPSTRLYSQTEVDAMYEDRMASQHTQLQSQHTQLQEQLRAQQMQTQALYEAIRRAGINVDLPSVFQSPPDTHLARGDQ